jgi:hypothetical protein
LWKERNTRTFNGTPRLVAQLLQVIEDEITMWTAAGLASPDGLRLFVVFVANYVYGVITTACESGEEEG